MPTFNNTCSVVHLDGVHLQCGVARSSCYIPVYSSGFGAHLVMVGWNVHLSDMRVIMS